MIKIKGTRFFNIEVEKRQVGFAIMQVVFELAKLPPDYDDAGLDWFTNDGRTYISDKEWLVSTNPNVAKLVDAVNILNYGNPLHFK